MITVSQLKDLLNDKHVSLTEFRESIVRLLAEHELFKRDVACFVAIHVPDASDTSGTPAWCALQRRMLTHLIHKIEPGDYITPSALADAIGERNRKAVREAGRLLAAKDLLVAKTEPFEGREGERVLGYTLTGAFNKTFEDYLDRLAVTLEAEAEAAVKQ